MLAIHNMYILGKNAFQRGPQFLGTGSIGVYYTQCSYSLLYSRTGCIYMLRVYHIISYHIISFKCVTPGFLKTSQRNTGSRD